MQLENKIVVVTGGTGGIGSVLTKLLLDEGAKIISVDQKRGRELQVEHIMGDLSKPNDIAMLGKELAFRKPDIIVNLAGIQFFGELEQQSAEHIIATYNVNLLAPVLLTRALLPGMKARGSGKIVNVGSTFASINFAHFVTYSSSKSGIKGFSEALRRELKGSGIDVAYIAPRAVKTPLNSDSVLQFAEKTKMKMDTPLYVAERIVSAIKKNKKEVYIGVPEHIFTLVNAVLPRVVDKALIKNNKLAKDFLVK